MINSIKMTKMQDITMRKFFIFRQNSSTLTDCDSDVTNAVYDPTVKFWRIHTYTVYRQTSNIRHALESNRIIAHSDVVVGAAPTTSSFST